MTVKKCIVCGKKFEAKGRDKCCNLECSRKRHKQYNKKYYQHNKEKLKKSMKQYYQKNREAILEYKKRQR